MKLPLFVGSAAILCAACQTYSSVAIPSLSPNADVRVTFTADGSSDMTRLVGPHVTALEGRVISIDTNTVRIAVRDLVHSDGSFNLYHDEIVPVPRGAIASTEVKRLSRGRSVLLAGALVAGGAVAATQLGSGSEGPGHTTGPGTTPTK
jgi:hypothetical protein